MAVLVVFLELEVISVQITLPPELDEVVRGRIASGRNRNASEVIVEAVALLEERERERELLLAALERGEERATLEGVIAWSPAYMDRLVEEARVATERNTTGESGTRH